MFLIFWSILHKSENHYFLFLQKILIYFIFKQNVLHFEPHSPFQT